MKINSDGSVSKSINKNESIHLPQWMVDDCAASADLAEYHADYFVSGGCGELAQLCREIAKYNYLFN